MNRIFILVLCIAVLQGEAMSQNEDNSQITGKMLVVLGVAQDAGYPQAGCQKSCCLEYWEGRENKRLPTSLAIVDVVKNKFWLFEASPEIGEQLNRVGDLLGGDNVVNAIEGIFLTHAHIGHYTGLMHFGREVMGTDKIPVYCMPHMGEFLKSNGPWSQLVKLENIVLNELKDGTTIELDKGFSVTPFTVPHRDEFSETVGYKISGPNKKVLFIPDIDKWSKWNKNLIAEIHSVDMAFIDGTFYENGEIPGRDMSEIPHPFIQESMEHLQGIPEFEKAKVHFIHFNHTNPVLRDTPQRQEIIKNGFKVAQEGSVLGL